MRGGKLTKPGGHYEEMRNLQNGIKNRTQEYEKKCRNDDDDGPSPPPIPRNIDALANAPVECPRGIPVIPGKKKRDEQKKGLPVIPPVPGAAGAAAEGAEAAELGETIGVLIELGLAGLAAVD